MAIVKYGIIGGGAIAQRRHLPEAHASPNSTVAAIADPVADRVKMLADRYGAEGYTDYKRMLAHADIDAVIVCGPNALHAPMSIDAFKAGKHVLCEKPMATTREDCRKMLAAAKKAGRYLMMGQNQRLMPPHVKAKQILKSGSLGKVLCFRTAFKHPGPEGWSVDGATSWFFKKGSAVMGVTGDLGVHKVDLLRWLLGQEFTEAGGFVETLHKKGPDRKPIPIDDNAFLTLKTDKGVIGSMILSWTNYGAEENYTILYCERGVMAIGMDPVYQIIVTYADGSEERHRVGKLATNESQVYSGVVDLFTDSIQRRKPPEIDGMEGYRSLNVILTAMDAAKAGKTLKIKH